LQKNIISLRDSANYSYFEYLNIWAYDANTKTEQRIRVHAAIFNEWQQFDAAFNLAQRYVFATLQFDQILFSVDDPQVTIREYFADVTRCKITHIVVSRIIVVVKIVTLQFVIADRY
jgi:hypothetical protein